MTEQFTLTDEALLLATEAGMLAERLGIELKWYQQQYLDQAFVRYAKDHPE